MPVRKPKTYERRLFTGRVTWRAPEWYRLHVDRTSWRKTLDKDGVELTKHKVPSPLWANIGDSLIVYPARLEIDTIAVVEVVSVDGDGTPWVRVLCGEMPSGETHVLPSFKAKKKRKAA